MLSILNTHNNPFHMQSISNKMMIIIKYGLRIVICLCLQFCPFSSIDRASQIASIEDLHSNNEFEKVIVSSLFSDCLLILFKSNLWQRFHLHAEEEVYGHVSLLLWGRVQLSLHKAELWSGRKKTCILFLLDLWQPSTNRPHNNNNNNNNNNNDNNNDDNNNNNNNNNNDNDDDGAAARTIYNSSIPG